MISVRTRTASEVFLKAPSGVRPVIFCFHHAGGNARIFQDWCSDHRVDIVPMEFPGHGHRMAEDLTADPDILSIEFSEVIAQLYFDHMLDHGFSLFGHSLGALIAFRVCEILIHQYGIRPECVQAAGRHAPQDEDPSDYRTSMGMNRLLSVLNQLEYTPKELLENQEFKNFLLPIIYTDYKMNENYVFDHQKISVPVYGYTGTEDPDATPEHMNRWSLVTDKKFMLRSFPGGHFFLYDGGNHCLDYIISDLLSCIQADDKAVPVQDSSIAYERGVI